MSLRRMMFAGLKNDTAINWALTSNGGDIYSNIAPNYGSLSNLLLGNRQVIEASGNYASWDFTGATEDLVIQISPISPKSIDKIVFAWGLNNAGTIAGSNIVDTNGFYFPQNSGELVSLESYNGTFTSIPFTTTTSRLQEYTFTQRTASSVEIVISKDITLGYLCMVGIEVWGN